MKKTLLTKVLTALCFCSLASAKIKYDTSIPEVAFGAKHIESALERSGESYEVTLLLDDSFSEQSYQITVEGKRVQVEGGDARGLMYGALELAEQIRLSELESVEGQPYIKRRGLKMNIPLDIRTPSYQDAGDAAQANIAEMWNWDFWEEYLDTMAEFRYNTLTLWNPHPFPSMIKLEEYPDIALEDVCGTSFPLDTDRPDEPVAKFIAGCGVSQEVLDNLIILKKMTMDEKIAFWRKVTRHAKDRGIDIYFITWNVKLNSVAPPGWYRRQELKMGDKGKYGINNDQENPRTVEYLRKSTTKFLETYPDIKGIGVTAGENMEDRDDEYDRELWMWATYGEGIMDYKKKNPDREIGFIHRVWQSGMPKIMSQFVEKYPDEIDFSFKYARARMHSTTAPPWSNEFQEEIKGYAMKSWWNVRNDDIFHFRWGDPEYVSEFIKNFPSEDVTAGYHMGSDSYFWGREFISKWPNYPRDLEIRKHWYNFMLWGRMGYDPDLDRDRIKAILGAHFEEIEADGLYDAWAEVSKIAPLVNRYHWRNWDFMWAFEGCLDLRKGFHDVNMFIDTSPMEGSGLYSIPDYVKSFRADRPVDKNGPFNVADDLHAFADDALNYVKEIRDSDLIVTKELSELLYDIEAMAYLGKYYAQKIRGAVYLYSYRSGGSQSDKDASVDHLERALTMWKNYATAATANYRPQFLSKTRIVDWIALTDDVRRDIEIAKNASFMD